MKITKKTLFFSALLIVIIIALYPIPQLEPNKYVDRKTGIIETEKVAGENWLAWLYYNPVGEATMFTIVKRKFLTSLYAKTMDSQSSVEKIKPFIKEYNIDISIAQNQEYNSFNDFFTRKLKENARPINGDSNTVISPADGKILAYSNISSADFIVKESRFNISSFLADSTLALKYNDGSLIVVRLAPYDYHRFHFPVSGTVSAPMVIDGDLYSVNPIALKQMVEIFFLNKREYVSIETEKFGDVIMSEVGATMVGSIISTYKGTTIIKGEEKGYFKFGGSTVVLLFEKDRIIIDDDLLKNTANGLETEVKMGEKIAILN